jgi:hypothetical protein
MRFMQRTIALGLISLAVAALMTSPASAQEAMQVYFVGNSVTDCIDYDGLEQLAESRGHSHTWGRHMIPGAPLQWIWEHPADGFYQNPYGLYPNALPNYEWDAISLQPFDRLLEGFSGDLAMASNFMELALTNPANSDTQFYVYARWPRQDNGDFDTHWLKEYTGGWDNTNETKDYFETLTLALRDAWPDLAKPVRMVPVGHVMYELNQRMQAGNVPGYTHIWDVYADGIHLNDVGKYIAGCTYFATLYGEDPHGLSGAPYNVTDADVITAIQDAVWDIVTTHPLSGVTGEPLIPGDANGDGLVTDADYTIWADNYGATGATWEMGDWNGNGGVTEADYTIWADNYTGATSGIPEPVTVMLLAMLAPALRRRAIKGA